MTSLLLHSAAVTASGSTARPAFARSCYGSSVRRWQSIHPTPQQLEHSAVRHPARLLCHAVKPKEPVIDLEKEKHKVFDEVFINVRSGDGGNGEVVEAEQGKWVKNYKYKAGGSQAKKIWLAASEPGDGADGADVVLVCEPSYDNLLHLHQRKQYTAPKGANANPATGSGGPKNNRDTKKARTAPLEIPVPPGTVVKRKSNGQLVGELVRPGERLLVALGGRGGSGVKLRSKESKQRADTRQARMAQEAGAEIIEVEDRNWRADVKGMLGQQLGLHLLMRVVADVGIVGYPNAGKSSLLAALTRAAPEVAPYPFTTLMPNLGVMAAGGWDDKAVLADLPGLIEGAHQGRGLGRMFLRHLRRTRIILHVVDAAAADPATDYYAVREELRLYNPDYCRRPHVVALNKMDLEDAGALVEELRGEVVAAALRHQQDQQESDPLPPLAVIPCSAKDGVGLQQLQAALQAALQGRRYKYVPETITYTTSAAASSSDDDASAADERAAGSSDGDDADALPGLDDFSDDAELEAFLEEYAEELAGFDEDNIDEALLAEAEAAEQGSAAGSSAAAGSSSSSSSSKAAAGSSKGYSSSVTAAAGGSEADDGEVEVEMAPADDPDLWLVNLSEEELLRLELE